jgi:hypothetical protein
VAKKRKNDDPDDFSGEDFGPNPEEHPDARAFLGYLRQAPDKKGWRLYLSLDFNDYIEIPPDSLIDQRSLATEANPLGGTVVWVHAASVLRRVSISIREAQAEFLRGEIVERNLSRAGTSWTIPEQPELPTVMSMCQMCLSRGPVCPGPTQAGGCNPTAPTRNCPSAVC